MSLRKRYRMFRRGTVYWSQYGETGKQESLGTRDRTEAERPASRKERSPSSAAAVLSHRCLGSRSDPDGLRARIENSLRPGPASLGTRRFKEQIQSFEWSWGAEAPELLPIERVWLRRRKAIRQQSH
jgi:hypothetical protein